MFDGNALDKTYRGARHGDWRSSAIPLRRRPPAWRAMPPRQRIDVAFVIEQGPRSYVERIEIHGNTRTRDYVIRREFDFGEGDRLQQDPDRSRRAAIEEPELLQDRQDFDASRARRRIASCSMSRSPTSRPATSTSPAATRPPMAGSPRSRSATAIFYGTGNAVKASVSYGQYAQGGDLSGVGARTSSALASPAGIDLFGRQADCQSAISPTAATSMARPCRWARRSPSRLGVQWRYSLYDRTSRSTRRHGRHRRRCRSSRPRPPARTGSPPVGDTVTYSTLDNNKLPTSGINSQLSQDLAGLGGDVKFLRTTEDVRYYQVAQRRPGRHGARARRLHHRLGRPAGAADEQLLRRPDHGARICARTASGRAISRQARPWIMSAAACTGQPPPNCRARSPACRRSTACGHRPSSMPAACSVTAGRRRSARQTVQVANSNVVRSSVGVGLTWASPFGALTANYAVPLTKASYDVVQNFNFSASPF